MRNKTIIAALFAVSLLSGCVSSNEPKPLDIKKEELASTSVAKKLMVALGAPSRFITDGDRPETAKFERYSTLDKVNDNAGLIAFATSLSITKTIVADGMTNDKARAWKTTLSKPVLFTVTSNQYDRINDYQYLNFINDYANTKGYKLHFNSYGYYKNGDKTYIVRLSSAKNIVDFSNSSIINGLKDVRSISVTEKYDNAINLSAPIELFNYLSQYDKDLYLYIPSSANNAAYVVDAKGNKYYFVKS
jgi:hypothetical protein